MQRNNELSIEYFVTKYFKIKTEVCDSLWWMVNSATGSMVSEGEDLTPGSKTVSVIQSFV